MNILSLLGTKTSLAIIGVLLVGATWGSLKFKIWKLESQLAKAQTASIQSAMREQLCTADLGQLRGSFSQQNKRIAHMQETAASLSLAAEQAARQILQPPAALETVIHGPEGAKEMNRFMAKLIEKRD